MKILFLLSIVYLFSNKMHHYKVINNFISISMQKNKLLYLVE